MSDSERPRRRTVRVDPYATSDLAREHHLTSNQAWMLHQLAIQAEYRSGEWTGTLGMVSDALRCGRKTATKDMAVLVTEGLVEEVEPFRGGTEGRVRVTVRDRIVIRSGRTGNASNDANGTDGRRCVCGEPVSGHTFSDHEPTPAEETAENASNDANGNASNDANADSEDRVGFASGLRPVRVGFESSDANGQGKDVRDRYIGNKGERGETVQSDGDSLQGDDAPLLSDDDFDAWAADG